ncbi:hypothetical protein QJQ45_020130 [Haematococcus lacustris]|nr:hypothetical protein QJQ45_020130 [Haematococcus lacustris]
MSGPLAACGTQPLVDQWAQVAINSYPKPIASHSQVSHDSNLFLRALQALHAHFNKKLRAIRKDGGLNLPRPSRHHCSTSSCFNAQFPNVGGVSIGCIGMHRLYKEVTERGGYEQVVTNKQWVAVCKAFDFSPRFTNRSFVIRTHYVAVLYYFEQARGYAPSLSHAAADPSIHCRAQVYFFSAEGPLTPLPAREREASSTRPQRQRGKGDLSAQDVPQSAPDPLLHPRDQEGPASSQAAEQLHHLPGSATPSHPALNKAVVDCSSARLAAAALQVVAQNASSSAARLPARILAANPVTHSGVKTEDTAQAGTADPASQAPPLFPHPLQLRSSLPPAAASTSAAPLLFLQPSCSSQQATSCPVPPALSLSSISVTAGCPPYWNLALGKDSVARPYPPATTSCAMHHPAASALRPDVQASKLEKEASYRAHQQWQQQEQAQREPGSSTDPTPCSTARSAGGASCGGSPGAGVRGSPLGKRADSDRLGTLSLQFCNWLKLPNSPTTSPHAGLLTATVPVPPPDASATTPAPLAHGMGIVSVPPAEATAVTSAMDASTDGSPASDMAGMGAAPAAGTSAFSGGHTTAQPQLSLSSCTSSLPSCSSSLPSRCVGAISSSQDDLHALQGFTAALKSTAAAHHALEQSGSTAADMPSGATGGEAVHNVGPTAGPDSAQAGSGGRLQPDPTHVQHSQPSPAQPIVTTSPSLPLFRPCQDVCPFTLTSSGTTTCPPAQLTANPSTATCPSAMDMHGCQWPREPQPMDASETGLHHHAATPGQTDTTQSLLVQAPVTAPGCNQQLCSGGEEQTVQGAAEDTPLAVTALVQAGQDSTAAAAAVTGNSGLVEQLKQQSRLPALCPGTHVSAVVVSTSGSGYLVQLSLDHITLPGLHLLQPSSPSGLKVDTLTVTPAAPAATVPPAMPAAALAAEVTGLAAPRAGASCAACPQAIQSPFAAAHLLPSPTAAMSSWAQPPAVHPGPATLPPSPLRDPSPPASFSPASCHHGHLPKSGQGSGQNSNDSRVSLPSAWQPCLARSNVPVGLSVDCLMSQQLCQRSSSAACHLNVTSPLQQHQGPPHSTLPTLSPGPAHERTDATAHGNHPRMPARALHQHLPPSARRGDSEGGAVACKAAPIPVAPLRHAWAPSPTQQLRIEQRRQYVLSLTQPPTMHSQPLTVCVGPQATGEQGQGEAEGVKRRRTSFPAALSRYVACSTPPATLEPATELPDWSLSACTMTSCPSPYNRGSCDLPANPGSTASRFRRHHNLQDNLASSTASPCAAAQPACELDSASLWQHNAHPQRALSTEGSWAQGSSSWQVPGSSVPPWLFPAPAQAVLHSAASLQHLATQGTKQIQSSLCGRRQLDLSAKEPWLAARHSSSPQLDFEVDARTAAWQAQAGGWYFGPHEHPSSTEQHGDWPALARHRSSSLPSLAAGWGTSKHTTGSAEQQSSAGPAQVPLQGTPLRRHPSMLSGDYPANTSPQVLPGAQLYAPQPPSHSQPSCTSPLTSCGPVPHSSLSPSFLSPTHRQQPAQAATHASVPRSELHASGSRHPCNPLPDASAANHTPWGGGPTGCSSPSLDQQLYSRWEAAALCRHQDWESLATRDSKHFELEMQRFMQSRPPGGNTPLQPVAMHKHSAALGYQLQDSVQQGMQGIEQQQQQQQQQGDGFPTPHDVVPLPPSSALRPSPPPNLALAIPPLAPPAQSPRPSQLHHSPTAPALLMHDMWDASAGDQADELCPPADWGCQDEFQCSLDVMLPFATLPGELQGGLSGELDAVLASGSPGGGAE